MLLPMDPGQPDEKRAPESRGDPAYWRAWARTLAEAERAGVDLTLVSEQAERTAQENFERNQRLRQSRAKIQRAADQIHP